VHLARVPAEGGAVERVVSGERVVEGFDVSPHGEVVVAETSPLQPTEVSAVGAGGALARVTTINDAVVKGLRLAPVTRHVAKSPDGTEIDYFVAQPPDAPAGTKVPALLRIHGGPVLQFTTGFNFEWQVYAAAGYAVVGGNPRGSSGRGGAWSRAIWADWGNKDLADVLAVMDAAVAQGIADPDRLVVGGHSYGGIMTNYVIARTNRFKAAIALSGAGFYLGNYGPDQYQRHYEYELGLPWKAPELYLKLSYPFLLAEKITTPVLYMGGDLDQNVPLLNTLQMYQAVRRNHRDTELVIYPGEHHDLARPSFLKDYYERSIAWYDARVKPKPAAK
jgi:dipeptidyl aminopeptidase/acylaminoacyl peptidase